MKNNIENGIYIPDDTRRLFTPPPEDLERWREYNRIEERRHNAEFVEYLKTKKQ